MREFCTRGRTHRVCYRQPSRPDSRACLRRPARSSSSRCTPPCRTGSCRHSLSLPVVVHPPEHPVKLRASWRKEQTSCTRTTPPRSAAPPRTPPMPGHDRLLPPVPPPPRPALHSMLHTAHCTVLSMLTLKPQTTVILGNGKPRFTSPLSRESFAKSLNSLNRVAVPVLVCTHTLALLSIYTK